MFGDISLCHNNNIIVLKYKVFNYITVNLIDNQYINNKTSDIICVLIYLQ